MRIKKFLLNCFILLIPIFAWNILLYSSLPHSFSPEVFWKDIPAWIAYGENILRIIVFVFPAFMIFSLKTRQQKTGFAIYLLGTLIYFLSWLMVILYPQSGWSTSLIGFMAPAYTTIFWFTGIGLIGRESYFRIPKPSQIYILVSILFVVFHSLHTYIVFQRL